MRKKVIITGAGSGIGRELAKLYSEKNYTIIGVDINLESLEETKTLISKPNNFHCYKLDVSNMREIDKFKDYVDSEFGRIDVLINNAGIMQNFVMFTELSDVFIKKIMDINFFGPVRLTKLFLPKMLEKNKGSIINISSMAGFFPFPKQSIYGASKAALKIFTEGLYSDLKETDIKVSIVFPGAIETNIVKNSNVNMKMESSKKYKLTSASKAAKEIIEKHEDDKFQIYIGKDAKFMNFLYSLNPKGAINYIINKMSDMR